jgi:hypothetical protein
MAKKKKRGRKRRHSFHKAGFSGPLKPRGRPAKKKVSKKTGKKRGRPARDKSVAAHMSASTKRGIMKAVHKIESVADHMMASLKRGRQ